MATTELNLSEDLQIKAKEAAERRGMSVHEFMVQAIERATKISEARSLFIADALAAQKHTEETGIAYASEDVHKYILAKARGENPAEPQPINLKRN